MRGRISIARRTERCWCVAGRQVNSMLERRRLAEPWRPANPILALDNSIDRRYHSRMIRSFKTKDAEAIWLGNQIKRYPKEIQNTARRKLRMMNNASRLSDLLIPPGNRLEPLKGNRKGQYSIRVNDQIRICFVWKDGDCNEVEIVDYHS